MVLQPSNELVLLANERCHPDILIEQLKSGVKALRMPLGDCVSVVSSLSVLR